MLIENRDKDGFILMDYPFETTIPLDKKTWVSLAQLLMKLEKLEGIDIKLEPGRWFESKKVSRSWLGKLSDFIIGAKTIYLLGSFVEYYGKDGKKIHEVIHIAVTDRKDTEILSTLLHEIAHALHVGDDHGKKWEAEYLRLMEDYHVFGSMEDLYQTLVDLYETPHVSTK